MGEEGPRGGATGRTLDAPVRRPVVAAERIRDADVSSLAVRLARLAARATGAPLSILTLVDADTQIVLGSAGWDGPVPRDLPMCRTVVDSGVPLIVSDTRLDPRFCTNAAVVLDGVAAYAGLPVHEDGKVVGVLAVLDRQPRQWTPSELAAAADAAALLAAGLGDHGRTDRAEVADRARADRQDAFLDALLESLRTGVIACDTDGQLVLVNHALREMTSIEAGDAGLHKWAEHIQLHHLDGRPFTPEELPLRRALDGETVRDESVMYLGNGARRVFSVNAQPIVDHAGTRLGAVAAIADVTTAERMQRFRAVELTIARGLTDGGSDLVAMGRTATRVVTDA
ncbi:MAG: hypothetical protein QOE03_2383 [Micromonosporaceae bacterium]|nr:hypothetical protein [Micromonosporaceae bacterium]